MAREGAPEGSWLRAGRQTGGKGRQGRAWQSPPGNLYASTLVRVRPEDPPAPTLALVAAVALHEVIEIYAPAVQIKWPNDLLFDGAKLAGILLEREGDAVIVGFGVNLAGHPDSLDRPATSLAAAHPLGTALATPEGEGLFEGLDDTGALRLRLADGGLRVIHAGDVFLL